MSALLPAEKLRAEPVSTDSSEVKDGVKLSWQRPVDMLAACTFRVSVYAKVRLCFGSMRLQSDESSPATALLLYYYASDTLRSLNNNSALLDHSHNNNNIKSLAHTTCLFDVVVLLLSLYSIPPSPLGIVARLPFATNLCACRHHRHRVSPLRDPSPPPSP